jgi:hypothetical protein
MEENPKLIPLLTNNTDNTNLSKVKFSIAKWIQLSPLVKSCYYRS